MCASRSEDEPAESVAQPRPALPRERLHRLYDGLASSYDALHALLTLRSDQRGRALLVEATVGEGDAVLDCGAGTGATALLATRKAGPGGRVMVFDLSEGMLEVARQKASRQCVLDRLEFRTGDMVRLAFPDDHFDAVLSTYSLCPVYDPQTGASEIYRVTRPGGRIGIAHSTMPRNPFLGRLAGAVEDVAWRVPWLSMGCRSVSVLPTLRAAGARVVLLKRFGVPLWPFLVFVVEKPAS